MQVHAIHTGTVQIHQRQRSGSGRGVLRFANTLLDSHWTEPLPILAWLIEHPEGLILVDTGETARTGEAGYFPPWHPYYRWALREQVRPDEEIGPRLHQLGFAIDDVRWVVLTHLHTDHAGGLSHFPNSEILLSRAEYEVAKGFIGKLRGYLPHRWPEWFAPRLIDFATERVGPFPASFPLTRAGDVQIVPTPGHSAGHMSVVVSEGERVLFIAGDTSYSEANLVAGILDGVASLGGGLAAAARALERIRAYARDRALVYLPSHDPESEARLRSRQTVTISEPHESIDPEITPRGPR